MYRICSRMLNKYFPERKVWGGVFIIERGWKYEHACNTKFCYDLQNVEDNKQGIKGNKHWKQRQWTNERFFSRLLFVSPPPCVPLSINERNLIIHCSVWLFTYLYKCASCSSCVWIALSACAHVCMWSTKGTTTSKYVSSWDLTLIM
jgi:hypothetical protein